MSEQGISSAMGDTKRHLQLLSHSEIQCHQRCPREHYFRYELRRRPVVEAQPLVFGKLVDECLQAWWAAGPLHGSDMMLAHLGELVMEEQERVSKGGKSKFDAFDVAKAHALLIGYDARWANEPYEVLRVQPMFVTNIVNPDTDRSSNTYELGGKLDVLVRDIRTHEIAIVETKTTSEDIASTSSYWRTISATDPQVSTYYKGARAILQGMGIKDDPARCIYDVIRKPTIKPYKATPPESRKYTEAKSKKCPECSKKKSERRAPHTFQVRDGEHFIVPDTAVDSPEPIPGMALFHEDTREIFQVTCLDGKITTDPGGKLYANLRDRDETPEEFFARLLEDIKQRPDFYYARGDIVRLERDEREHSHDLWHHARVMREMQLAKRAPRHLGQCKRFGRMCNYLPVCEGTVSIETFPVAEDKHEELKEI
jgi:hypothetical protein